MIPGRRDVDGGWAWMVFMASFINLLMASGIAFVSGIFQKLFLEQFGQSVAYTAWVTALFSSFMQLAGPMSGLLTSATNCRVTVMMGGALLSGGLAASCFATSLTYLFVTFGLIAGTGLGLFYTSSIVIVNFFFDRRRTVIMGTALSAGGIGIICSPMLSRFLIDHFSWRETMMILAAITAHVCVFGAIMFPVHEGPSPCLRQCRSLSKSGKMYSDPYQADGNDAAWRDRHSLGTQDTLDETQQNSASSKHNDLGVSIGVAEDVERNSRVVQRTESVNGELQADELEESAEKSGLLGKTHDSAVTDSGEHPPGKERLGSESGKKFLQHLAKHLHAEPHRRFGSDHFQHRDGSQTSLSIASHRRLPKGTGYSQSPGHGRGRGQLSHSFHHLDSLTQHAQHPQHHPPAPGATPAVHRLAHSWLAVGSQETDTPRDSRLDVRAISIFSSIHSLHSWGLPKMDLVAASSSSCDPGWTTHTAAAHHKSAQGDDVFRAGMSGGGGGDGDGGAGCRGDDGGGGGGGGTEGSYWRVLRSVPFLLLCLQLFLSNMACGIFTIHLPAFSQQRGLDDQDITFAMSVYGAGVFVTRILLGALGNDPQADKLAAYFGVHLIASFVQAAFPWTENMAGVATLNFLMGIYYAGGYALLTSLTIDILGLTSLPFAFGMEMIAAGLGFLVAPPLAGWIVDETRDYDNSMYFGGFVMLLSALSLLLIPCSRPPGAPPIGYNPPPPDTSTEVDVQLSGEEKKQFGGE